MRKLYALLAGIGFTLAAIPTHAQTPSNAVANFTFTINASGNVAFTNTSVVDTTTGHWKALWTFGDGSSQLTTILGNTQHQYQAAGSYSVCLKLLLYVSNTSEPVVIAHVCKTVVIESVCRANFERGPTTSNNPLITSFIAIPWHSNQNKPVYICWNFGDGNDTCIQYSNTFPGPYNVTHTYAHSGEYQVCVNIVYQGGCEARKCEMIRVVGPDSCRADFERIYVSTTNSQLHATFKAIPWHNNNKKPSKVCWTFGDGRDTCINYGQDYTGQYSVNHLYQAIGQYNVCVKITYYGGCEASKCREINLDHPDSCTANFERLPISTTNNPLTVTYKAIPWHSNGNKPRQVCWTFGDGRDTCINYLALYNGNYTVTHTYHQPGNYQVCVKINYYGGCESSKCKQVQVFSSDSCRADFERVPVTSSNNSLGATFKALPWHHANKKPSRICWTFGDGRDTCINYGADYAGQYLVNHNYYHPGNYQVCVKITYYGGCEASKCKIVEIARPDSCKADFERLPLTTSNNILTTAFRAIPWHNNNKKPSKICWTFGDGRDTCINYGPDYNGQYVVSHTYAQPGEYQVCVKILYYGGCDAHKCERINVPHQSCNVHLFQLASSANNLQRGFYAAASSNPPRRIDRICWNFGDGQDTCINATGTDSVNRFISHTYPGPGVYRACVKVYFEGGCIAHDCEEVVIRSNTDLCGGYMTDSLVGPRTFKFKGYSIHRPNDEVLSYRWTFGDGTSALGQEVTHTYNVAGEYRVCLTILTRSGCETKICNTVRIPGNNTPRLVITPNPVISILHSLFYSTHSETVTIKVINSSGVIIRSVTRNAVVGANNWDFDASSLLPGYYSFVVQSPNQFASALFLKQ
jgi:PKD repeat protein